MANVIEYLKSFRQRQQEARSQESSVPNKDRVLAMTAREFQGADMAILVRSYLLGESFVIMSTQEGKNAFDGDYVHYLPEEFALLCQLSPDAIKRVHQMKKLTDGQIIGYKGVTRD